jgi:polyferredoxin
LKPAVWNKLRKLSQVIAFILFVYLFVQSPYLHAANPLNGLFFRLDPLAAITAMLAGRLIIPLFFLSIVTLVLTLIFGRTWCGWLCPLGTVLEWTSPQLKAKRLASKKEPDKSWRKGKFLLILGILVLALLGNQSLLFLDPNTILTRSMAGVVFPALRFGILSSENFLYQFKLLWPILDEIHTTLIVPIFHNNQAVFIASLPIFLFLLLLIALNWSAERFWCRYVCPLGGLLGWFSRFALLRREVSQPCSECGLCSARCPTGTIDPQAGYRSDPSECIVCTDCLRNCNQGKVTFRWQLNPWRTAARQPYDPSRRDGS